MIATQLDAPTGWTHWRDLHDCYAWCCNRCGRWFYRSRPLPAPPAHLCLGPITVVSDGNTALTATVAAVAHR